MKTNKGYKCFEMDTEGNLYALFIDRNTVMPANKWIEAEMHKTKGFSFRPGLHIGEIPDCLGLSPIITLIQDIIKEEEKDGREFLQRLNMFQIMIIQNL